MGALDLAWYAKIYGYGSIPFCDLHHLYPGPGRHFLLGNSGVRGEASNRLERHWFIRKVVPASMWVLECYFLAHC